MYHASKKKRKKKGTLGARYVFRLLLIADRGNRVLLIKFTDCAGLNGLAQGVSGFTGLNTVTRWPNVVRWAPRV
jgi:hypothetical protein